MAPHFKNDLNIYNELMHLSELIPTIYSLLLSKLRNSVKKRRLFIPSSSYLLLNFIIPYDLQQMPVFRAPVQGHPVSASAQDLESKSR